MDKVAPDERRQINVELVKLLFQQLKFGLLPESVAVIVIAAIMFGTVSNYLLLPWLFSNLLLCGVARNIMLYYYYRSDLYLHNNPDKLNLWLRLFSIGVLISGISWGMTSFVLMLNVGMEYERFVIILFFGATATANALYSPVKGVYALFVMPALLPFSLVLMMQGGIFITLGLLSLVYLGIALVTANYAHRLIYTAVRLRVENTNLVENLSTANIALKNRTREIEQSLSLVKATLESTTDGIIVVSRDGVIRDYNKKFLDMWGLTKSAIDKEDLKKMIVFVSDQIIDTKSLLNRIEEVTENPDIESADELAFKDGRVFECYSHPQRIRDKSVGRVWSFRDVTGRKLMEAKLYYQANYDTLTNLPNRVLVLDRIQQGINYAKQHHLCMAVMFLDLDRFKLINDTLGHSQGDKLLSEVATRLSRSVRESDTVSRGGGDEFLIVLPALNDESESVDIVSRCFDSLHERPFIIEGNKYNCGVSIGISFYPRDGQDAETLIRNADIAMYRAKELGRNNIQYFTEELNNKIKTRLIIENELREAFTQKDFTLAYQPIVSVKSRKVVGIEALMRWHHATLGEISPNVFIPIAEECGMIIKIGEWVLRQACAQVRAWQDAGLDPVQMNINFSARQFKLSNIFDQIQRALSEMAIDPRYIALELTESIIMEDVEKNIAILNKMKAMNIDIVIDDFGIGYSSLNYLKKLPLDKLKIDKSFIQDIPGSESDKSITAAIIALAANLNLKVIAEGVETVEQLNFLISHDCDEIQGFYFSEPLDAVACTKLLRENRELDMSSDV